MTRRQIGWLAVLLGTMQLGCGSEQDSGLPLQRTGGAAGAVVTGSSGTGANQPAGVGGADASQTGGSGAAATNAIGVLENPARDGS